MRQSNALSTLSATLWPVEARSTLVRQVVLAVAGTVLLALSAKAQVPFYPVPMTMQTYVVLILAASFGWRLGVATIALYLVEGFLFSIPVFAGPTAGLAYLFSPTAGYLFSYLVVAGLVGYFAEQGWDRSPLKALVIMTAGSVINLGLGAMWLAAMIGVEKAIALGVMPFLLAGALKIGLAAATLPIAWKLVRR